MPKFFPYILVFLHFALFIESRAQESYTEVDPILVNLKARLVSVGDSMGIPYANVLNMRNRSGTSSNAAGYFTLEILNIDSLTVTAMGFKPCMVKVPLSYTGRTTLVIYMEPVVYPLREVTVTGEKPEVNLNGVPMGKPSTVPVELRGDAYNEKPPVLAALFNPMSYWQYYLSRKEKQKRRVREALNLEKNWEMHSQNYNKEMVRMLTGLDDMEADSFMIWFNSKNVLPYTSTEYEVRASIREWFDVYKKEKEYPAN